MTNAWLIPFSWLYGAGVWMRNTLFDKGVLRSQSFNIPVIAVGNLAVGGTGKTPHVEHLVRLLRDNWRIAILSRGYKRRTKGFVLASTTSTAADIGDEPRQLKSKFGNITIAVDADRCHGIRKLMKDSRTRATQVIILDDAFQHRYVKPGLSIVLIEYGRLYGDMLLPAGRLREPMSNLRRADIIVVTKCPDILSEEEKASARDKIKRYAEKPVFFSRMVYQDLEPVFCGDSRPLDSISAHTNVLLVTGIAHAEPLADEIRKHTTEIRHLAYGDHHDFSATDISNINTAFAALPTPRMLITTEKDASRLSSIKGLTDEVRQAAWQLPIHTDITNQDQFDQMVTNYLNTTRNISST